MKKILIICTLLFVCAMSYGQIKPQQLDDVESNTSGVFPASDSNGNYQEVIDTLFCLDGVMTRQYIKESDGLVIHTSTFPDITCTPITCAFVRACLSPITIDQDTFSIGDVTAITTCITGALDTEVCDTVFITTPPQTIDSFYNVTDVSTNVLMVNDSVKETVNTITQVDQDGVTSTIEWSHFDTIGAEELPDGLNNSFTFENGVLIDVDSVLIDG